MKKIFISSVLLLRGQNIGELGNTLYLTIKVTVVRLQTECY